MVDGEVGKMIDHEGNPAKQNRKMAKFVVSSYTILLKAIVYTLCLRIDTGFRSRVFATF